MEKAYKIGLQLYLRKYEVMRIGVDAKLQLNTHLREMEFGQMEESVYLGIRVTRKFEREKETEKRLS